ncbi:MAG: rhomboid family intramembrane serine protease [Bacteroidota bacterium]
MEQHRPQGFQILPPVVKNLLIINAIFYLATFALANMFDLTDELGLHFPTSEKFRIYQFITYMFLHAPDNFFHIFFNMFALWMFGSPIENYWGGKRFLQFYIFCGIGAAITHYTIFYFESRPILTMIDAFIQNPSAYDFKSITADLPPMHPENISDALMSAQQTLIATGSEESMVHFLEQYRTDFLNAPVVIGASGAVFGILLAFGMTFPNSMIYIYFFLPMKAKYFVILYGALELWSGLSNNPQDNVAHFAHLGGMLFGLALILYWRNRRRRDFYH